MRFLSALSFILATTLTLTALSTTTVQAAIILQYHHVATNTPKTTSVTPAEFRQQMQLLKEQKMKVVSLERFINQLKAGEPLADNEVAITFDDGFENVFTNARPILREFGYP